MRRITTSLGLALLVLLAPASPQADAGGNTGTAFSVRIQMSLYCPNGPDEPYCWMKGKYGAQGALSGRGEADGGIDYAFLYGPDATYFVEIQVDNIYGPDMAGAFSIWRTSGEDWRAELVGTGYGTGKNWSNLRVRWYLDGTLSQP